MKQDTRKFVGSMFDLAFGAADEKLTRAEVRSHLKEAGIDPDAAWARASKALAASRGGGYAHPEGGPCIKPYNPTAEIAAIGTNRTVPRYYAESDGDKHRKTFYVAHTWGRPRIDCKSMAEARDLAKQLNIQECQRINK